MRSLTNILPLAVELLNVKPCNGECGRRFSGVVEVEQADVLFFPYLRECHDILQETVDLNLELVTFCSKSFDLCLPGLGLNR